MKRGEAERLQLSQRQRSYFRRPGSGGKSPAHLLLDDVRRLTVGADSSLTGDGHETLPALVEQMNNYIINISCLLIKKSKIQTCVRQTLVKREN